MKHIELKGQVREAGNKAAVKAVRRAGQVPCNIYGLGIENVLFTIDRSIEELSYTRKHLSPLQPFQATSVEHICPHTATATFLPEGR